MLCYVMLCYVMLCLCLCLCYVMLCYVMLCCEILPQPFCRKVRKELFYRKWRTIYLTLVMKGMPLVIACLVCANFAGHSFKGHVENHAQREENVFNQNDHSQSESATCGANYHFQSMCVCVHVVMYACIHVLHQDDRIFSTWAKTKRSPFCFS